MPTVAKSHSFVCTAGAQSIAYFAGKSSDFTFAAAQADSVSTCLLKASTSVDANVQVSFSKRTCALTCDGLSDFVSLVVRRTRGWLVLHTGTVCLFKCRAQ